MNEKTKLLQVRVAPSVIARVKEIGYGSFQTGLMVLLEQSRLLAVERDKTENLLLWYDDAMSMARAIASVQDIVDNCMGSEK
jgi:hypothetical protein